MIRSLAAPLLLALSAVAAGAADLPPPAAPPAPVFAVPAETPDWAFQITPYMWASGLKGDVSPFRFAPTIHVDKSFSDVMKDLNLGGFLHVWARRGPFVLASDIMYVNTTDARSSGPLPIIGAVSARLTTATFHASLLGGYRVVDTPDFTVDALAGARYWHISNRATFAVGPISLGFKENFEWVDPLVGARAFWRLSDKVSIQAQGDLGGFGAGSKFTWQALATVNYVFTDSLSASLGYKILKVDYNRGGYVFDTTMSGPIVGMTYRF